MGFTIQFLRTGLSKTLCIQVERREIKVHGQAT